MKKFRVSLIMLLLVFIPVTVFSQVTYHSKNRTLSVRSEGRLLSEVLSEISAKTGMDVYIDPAVDRKVFVDIKNQPLEEALKGIIKPLNNVFVYSGKSVKAVKIFKRSEAEATAKISPGSPLSKPAATSPAQDVIKKTVPTKKELGAMAKDRRRQQAVQDGKLKEFEAKEKTREKMRAERDKQREERRTQREKMRTERGERIESGQGSFPGRKDTGRFPAK